MDETRARAALPNLDIEVTHRRLPDEGAEYLSVSLRATPSFDAVGRFLEAHNPVWPWPWLALMTPPTPFFAPWLQLTQAAWAPWLAAGERFIPMPAREASPARDDPPIG